MAIPITNLAMAMAIGIDLRTTYSCVGVWHHDRVEIIANDQGNRITPSRVSFTDTERLVGDAAKNDALVNTSNSVYDGKRLIGRPFSDALVQSDMKMWPFKVVRGLKDKPIIEVQYRGKKKQLSAEEISSMVLMKMKQTAEDYLGHTVNDAVVTVPAYFNNSQRHATKNAGTIAGFNVLRIMDEPTAAAVAYGFNELQDGNSFPKNIFVFDLGGGTLDVSLLTVTDSLFEVKATAGDTHSGGEDFDNRMVKHFIEELKRKHKKDITCNARALARLKSVCERAKRCLSSNTMASVQVDSLYDGIDFSSKISQARFDELNMDLFSKCMELVDRCLKDAKIEKQNVDDVILVGASTRIVKVQKLLQDYFNGKELCRDIDPDEAVAYGATVQAAKLSGHGNKPVQNLELVDATPLSLGIDTIGDKMETVVPRNTPIPIRKERVFTTSVHNQTNVSFKVFEGEGELTTSNHLLGMFNLLDIRSAPIGVPKLEVCFDIDADGILNVTALDRRSGRKNNITIKNEQDKLTKADIDRMIADANQYKIKDAENRRKASARNNLENYACEMRSAVENPKFLNSIPSEKKDRVDAAVGNVLNWLDDNQLPDVSDCEVHLRALKLVCDPIIKQ